MLSVCIISRNEEAVIADCIRSVAAVADEIILLDTGSADRTVAIAESFGCQVYHYIWDGNFTRARNTVCSYARHEWILCLDCDERLRFPARVHAAIQSAPANTGCIIAERHNLAVASDGERSAEMRGNARLFRNIPEIYWSFEVHEETWSSCVTNGLGLHHSNIVFDHEVWRPGYDGFLQKQRYYDSLLDDCIRRDGQQHYLFHSAKTRMLFDEYDKALEIFALAEQAGGYQVHNDAFIQCYKGYSAFMQKDLASAETYLYRSLGLVPGLSAAYFYLVNLYLRQGKYAEALDSAGKLVLTGAVAKPLTVADMYFKEVQVNYWKAFALLQMDRLEEASRLLLHEQPDADSARALSLQARIAFIRGNKKEARHWIEEALVHNPGWQQLQALKARFA